ncbi:hypothetical protein [Chthonobacter albigriseus]|uniref:hypothetical protein n=1 Tax=Chthonobacter albigriseus TaxID=1683161 RepID=UPI0015EEDD8C|nr:hypothetical protein [Chthonobacter albigriseus]
MQADLLARVRNPNTSRNGGVAAHFSHAQEISTGIRQMAEQYRVLVQRLQAMDLRFD